MTEVFRDSMFYPSMHYHQEIQISYIQSGKGKAIIGYENVSFKPGDIFIIGSEVPHVFKSEKNEDQIAEALSIYINTEKFLLLTRTIEELGSVKDIIELKGCLKIPENIKIKRVIESLPEKAPFEGFLSLVELLQSLLRITNRQEISILRWKADYDERINRVMDYLFEDFDKKISLSKAADLSHMTEPAFCRYFKKYTGRSFITFLNELRIRNACELIAGTNRTYADISSMCGFNNLSNFNRQFKKTTGMTPSTYREEIQVNRY